MEHSIPTAVHTRPYNTHTRTMKMSVRETRVSVSRLAARREQDVPTLTHTEGSMEKTAFGRVEGNRIGRCLIWNRRFSMQAAWNFNGKKREQYLFVDSTMLLRDCKRRKMYLCKLSIYRIFFARKKHICSIGFRIISCIPQEAEHVLYYFLQ